jgi:hypothetical protein
VGIVIHTLMDLADIFLCVSGDHLWRPRVLRGYRIAGARAVVEMKASSGR